MAAQIPGKESWAPPLGLDGATGKSHYRRAWRMGDAVGPLLRHRVSLESSCQSAFFTASEEQRQLHSYFLEEFSIRVPEWPSQLRICLLLKSQSQGPALQ